MFFRNERQENVSETSEFKSKSTWSPPKGALALELFLSQKEKDILSILPGKATNYNLSKEKYLTIRSLQNDRSVVIKPADKWSVVVVWDRNDYLKEVERQASDEKIYEEIRITEKDQVELVEKSNDLISNLIRKNVITENESNYFRFNFKKATNLGKLYLLPKIQRGLCKVPGRPVISNCGTPTEKVSEFLDHHLQPIMKQGESYIRETGDFLAKLKTAGEVPKGAILVTADVVGLYPSIPHSVGLNILKKQCENYPNKKVYLKKNIVKMADFVPKNNLFEFDSKFYKQISGTAIGMKFATPYACIFMDHIETDFLKTQEIKPWFWKRFVDDIFFKWTESEESLEKFLEDLNKFHPNFKFTYEKSKEKINFLDVVTKIKEGWIITDLYFKPADGNQYLYYDSCHDDHIKRSIIFSQTLRLKRICFEKNDLNVHAEDLKTWFCKRGYPDYLIKEQVEKILRLTPSDENNSKEVNGVPLVVTYNPAFKNLLQVIRKNLQLLYAAKRPKKCFQLSHLFP